MSKKTNIFNNYSLTLHKMKVNSKNTSEKNERLKKVLCGFEVNETLSCRKKFFIEDIKC